LDLAVVRKRTQTDGLTPGSRRGLPGHSPVAGWVGPCRDLLDIHLR